MWHSMGKVDLVMNKSGSWEEVPEMVLEFVLPERARIRVLYSMTLLAEHGLGVQGEKRYTRTTPQSDIPPVVVLYSNDE